MTKAFFKFDLRHLTWRSLEVGVSKGFLSLVLTKDRDCIFIYGLDD